MKRSIRLTASDGSTRIHITARIDTATDAEFTRSEIDLLRRALAERLMLTLTRLPYTGIGLVDIKQ